MLLRASRASAALAAALVLLAACACAPDSAAGPPPGTATTLAAAPAADGFTTADGADAPAAGLSDAAPGAGTLVLIKVHRPTAAMKERFCLLPADLARSAAFAGARFHIQLYVADEARVPADPLGCAPLVNASSSVLTRSDLRRLWPDADTAHLHSQPRHLSGVAEVAFYAKHRPPGVDYLWVLEQDVAWKGNLFDALATFSTWGEDLLCQHPHTEAVGNNGWSHQFLHSGWANNTKGAPRHVCRLFVARYSSKLLRTLSEDYLAKDHWAHLEMFSPGVCALGAPSCTIADYQIPATKGVFGEPFTCCVKEEPPNWKSSRTWERTGDDVPRLYHPAKQ